MQNNNQYLCYLPMSMCELDGVDLKFMISVMYKMRLNKKVENIEFRLEDAKGISRMSFFRSIKSLKEASYLKISKVDKSTYAISLNMESGHYTEQDIEHLTRPFRNTLPGMTMHTAAQSIPQIKQPEVSKICQDGNHDDCMTFNKSCGCDSFAPKVPFLVDFRCRQQTLGASATLSAKLVAIATRTKYHIICKCDIGV